MTVPYSERTGYGFLIDGSRKPLRISLVERGSMSQEAGLMSGDLLLKVNGHDVREAILQTVQSIISYSTGSPLTLKIARPQEREAEGKVSSIVIKSLIHILSLPLSLSLPLFNSQPNQVRESTDSRTRERDWKVFVRRNERE